MKRTARLLTVCAALGLGALATAGVAQATPYFQIVGGAQETQLFPVPIIPNGAKGFDNETAAMSIFLRDTSAPTGTPVTVLFNFVGSDSAFTNEFNAGGGAIKWCWAASGNCDAGYTPVTGPNNFAGPFTFTGSITATVDSVIPFSFFANVSPGPVLTLSDGGAGIPGSAHLIALDMTNGFDFANFNSTGRIFALGLTDGNFGGVGDDDHQDFILTMAVPEPASLLLIGAGVLGLAALRRRRG